MKANSDKSKQSKKATRRVLAGVLCGASVLSLVLSLVMPPISQAIANDAKTVSAEATFADASALGEDAGADENVLGEEAGAGNSTGKDAENQNSDDAEGGASEDAVTEGQPSDDTEAEGDTQPAADGANGDGAIALAAENEPTHEISSGDELSSKLLKKDLRDANGCATFKLVNDIEYNQEIRFEQTDDNPINITLDLNGHKIKYSNPSAPLFDVANGATLTITDSAQASETVNDGQPITEQGQSLTAGNYGKKAELTCDDNGIPSDLAYYVTESSPNGTGTTETLVKHSVKSKGAIVACSGNGNLKLINLYNNNGKGGTFNLESGVVTQKQGSSVSSLIYAENSSTVSVSGGYVCGASGSGAGGGIEMQNNSTLSVSGGVIAGNCAPSGGGVYARGSAVKVTGGVISGNSTLNEGLGGGIMAEGGIVTVSGGYITNNRMSKFCGTDGSGCHGGAGLAANNGAHVTISGGQITGNYSEEAGGGVYVTNIFQHGMAWLNITGGNIASNVSYRSEGAGIRVGQQVDAMINGTPDNNDTPGSKVYITNNHCMSRFDWGGGGIFVQGSNETASNAGRLFVYSSYISTNTAGGYGGGVAVCPTGKTLVTNTEGTAIFGNTDAGGADSYDSKNNNNDGNPHLSGGGNGKTEDKDAYNSVDGNGDHVFRDSGHADFFLAAKNNNTPVAVVTGKMLGDIDAKYSGSIELTNHIAIPANGAAQVKNSIGLTSGVKTTDKAATDAIRNKATTFITGNYSWDHGGGIMSNGNLYLGVPADTYVYPSLKLKATKALINQQTNQSMKFDKGKFSFSVYRKDSDGATRPSWNDKTFDTGGCTLVGTAENDENGNITFDLGEQVIDKTVEANEITYYLVENASNDPYITYDPAVYEIAVTFEDHSTVLMSVPTQNDPNNTKELKVHNYTFTGASVFKHSGNSNINLGNVQSDGDGYYPIGCSDGSKSFANKYTPYTGSWTPKATKVVKGGEMKEFTLEFANNEKFDNAKTVNTTAGGNNPQTLGFGEINYTLDDLTKGEDVTGRGASKTFTYYVREQQPTTPFTNYKYDKSVYKITVTATDQSDKTIKCDVTYTKIVDAKGGEIAEKDQNPLKYGEDTNAGQSLPTFTNTYSTSLPLSGMSGVTLTYLAGAAVLCAAAAWMHIRRKANAKGGERRE